jgi:hypothetical protein
MTNYENLTTSDSVTSITRAGTYPGWLSHTAIVVVEGAPVRYFCDGNTPTPENGIGPMNPGSVIHLRDRGEILNFKAISITGVEADLTVELK